MLNFVLSFLIYHVRYILGDKLIPILYTFTEPLLVDTSDNRLLSPYIFCIMMLELLRKRNEGLIEIKPFSFILRIYLLFYTILYGNSTQNIIIGIYLIIQWFMIYYTNLFGKLKIEFLDLIKYMILMMFLSDFEYDWNLDPLVLWISIPVISLRTCRDTNKRQMVHIERT